MDKPEFAMRNCVGFIDMYQFRQPTQPRHKFFMSGCGAWHSDKVTLRLKIGLEKLIWALLGNRRDPDISFLCRGVLLNLLIGLKMRCATALVRLIWGLSGSRRNPDISFLCRGVALGISSGASREASGLFKTNHCPQVPRARHLWTIEFSYVCLKNPHCQQVLPVASLSLGT